MEVVKRRNKHNQPCNDNWKGYDDSLLEQHIKAVGCRAPYQKGNNKFTICASKLKMKNTQFELWYMLFSFKTNFNLPLKIAINTKFHFAEHSMGKL